MCFYTNFVLKVAFHTRKNMKKGGMMRIVLAIAEYGINGTK